MKPTTRLSARLPNWVVPGCIALALGVALSVPLAASAQQSQVSREVPRIYTHSSGAFSLMPPPDTQLAERNNGLAVTIRSPKGYMISVQGGPARKDLSLADRMAAFEAGNVGEGKRWPRKLGGRETKVDGHPAFEALYLSKTEAARVTIMQAGDKDYVFIYVAPPRNYAAWLGEYFGVMASFHPNGGASPASAPAGPTAAGQARTGPLPNAGRVMMFADAEFGLSLRYPATWTANRTAPSSVLFSGAQGTDAYYATVRLDRVSVPPHGDLNESLREVVDDLRHQINTGTRNPVFMIDRPHKHFHDGMVLMGHEVLAAFTYRNQRFRRWIVVLPRPAMAEAYVWTYTAPDSTFDRYRQIASQMLDSMAISAPETAATKF